jgi:hypothetical protein
MYYFLLSQYNGPTKANYQHVCVVFAEGLWNNKIKFASNIDYYPDENNNYLFKKKELGDEEYIVTSAPEEFDSIIKNNKEKKLIIFDTKDEWVRHKSAVYSPYCYRYFMSTCRIISDKIRPLCFGITERMINATRLPSIPWSERSKKILWCHRVDNHQLRHTVKQYYKNNSIVINEFIDNFKRPDDSSLHYWNHTGRRHSPEYFHLLRQHRYLDAHGGYGKPTSRTEIIQWDSWKVWEGFLSGCLVITADLEYYKIKLPFQLIPFEHYIPIRYDQIEGSYDKLFRLSDEEQEKIAQNGRKFVLEHYLPEKIANYIINHLN